MKKSWPDAVWATNEKYATWAPAIDESAALVQISWPESRWATDQQVGNLAPQTGESAALVQKFWPDARCAKTKSAFEPISGVELICSSGFVELAQAIADNRQIVTMCLSFWRPTMFVHRRIGLRGPRPEQV